MLEFDSENPLFCFVLVKEKELVRLRILALLGLNGKLAFR